ncbi:transporter [Desulfosarcina alkanivorans]|uniref:Transporter n=1 Tax=Desulfosarcina alkanivorans TaxID=571177 RepID=A0A5K7YCR1_9BACT|nr:TolC family protein [Desulfosarcina alkanivorans]BBO66393.1 transporter [Desulfosarcina alkanivorans]
MKKALRTTVRTIVMLFAGGGLLLTAGCVSIGAAADPPRGYSDAIAAQSKEIEGHRPSAPAEALRKLEKDGYIHLSLSDCLKIALQQNYDIRLTREVLTQADTKITQARSAMLPFLGAEASYTRLDEELSFAMGPQSLTFMDRDQYKAGLVIRQPIFTGGRLDAARKASQYSRDAQAQENRALEEEVVFQVTRAYRTAQLAEAFQGVAVEAVDLLEMHEHDVAILVEKGANPEIDLLRTRTELANARKELNGADNAVDLAYSALKHLLSIPLTESVKLTEALALSPRPEADLSSLTELALSQRPELSAIDSKVAAAEQALKAAKGEYLPTIALEGRYEYMEGDFRDLEGGDHWTVGIGAQLPLWNWGKTAAKVREARSQRAQVSIQRDKTTDRIRLEVRQAFLNIGKAEKNIDAAESALKTAKEAYRQARARYRAGEGTNTDVLDVRTALSRAEANHTQALFDYNVALAALHRAVGVIVIEPPDSEEKESAK